MTRWPKARLAITAAAILTISILLAGCGTPDESLPNESLPNDNGALLLASMEFSCGAGHFPSAALSGPVGAERAADAPAAALRALVAAPPVAGRPSLPVAGYRLLVSTQTSTEYAAASDQFDTGLAYVRLELGPSGWTLKEFGDCRPQAVFNGLNSATWHFAPDVPFPNRASTRFTALVSEMTCTSGRTADGRVLPPAILASATEILVIFAVRPPPPSANGLEACPAPPPTRVDVTLPQPLGNRPLLDGGISPSCRSPSGDRPDRQSDRYGSDPLTRFLAVAPARAARARAARARPAPASPSLAPPPRRPRSRCPASPARPSARETLRPPLVKMLRFRTAPEITSFLLCPPNPASEFGIRIRMNREAEWGCGTGNAAEQTTDRVRIRESRQDWSWRCTLRIRLPPRAAR